MKEGDKIYIDSLLNNKYSELSLRKVSYDKQYLGSILNYDSLPFPVVIRTFLWENYHDVIGFYEYEDMKILSKDEQIIKDIIE
jgi:hypothetical protein